MFKGYPYLNYNDLNLDYVFKKLSEMDEQLAAYVKRSTITFHDPITWDITDQYTVNTMVIDTDGTAYLSVKTVPAGIDISNTDYWQPIFNYDDNINTLRGTIAANERSSSTATAARAVGDLVYLNNYVYKVTVAMNAGDAYIIGTNCVRYTVSDRIRDLIGLVDDEKTAREEADGDLQDNIDAEALARGNADTALGGRIDAEALARGNADTALGGRIDAEALARENADTALGGRIDAEALARVNADDELRGLIATAGTTRRYILVGDSYGESPDDTHDWETYVLNYANLTNSYKCHLSGASFGGPVKFLTALQGIENSVVNKQSITDIIVCGGYNEIGYENDIDSGISDFITYMVSKYPNARLHIGLIGLTKNMENNFKIRTNVLPVYRKACRTNAAYFIEGSQNIFHNYSYLASDGIHPNNDGSVMIATGITNYICNGVCSINGGGREIVEVYPASGISLGTQTWHEREMEDSIHLVFSFGLSTFSTRVLTTKVALFYVNPNLINGGYDDTCNFTVPVSAFSTTTNTWKTIPLTCYIENGILNVVTTALDNFNQLYMTPCSVTIPKDIC